MKILDYPTHAASLPVAMIPNCAATRHVHFHLDGSGPVALEAPRLEDWPDITYDNSNGKRVNLDAITPEEVQSWRPGDVLLLNGKILTGRDAAHKRMVDMLNKGEAAGGLHQPLHLLRGSGGSGARRSGGPGRPHHRHPHGQVHPSDAGANRLAGHDRQGRARPTAIEAIKDNKAVYLMAVGGSAYLVSKAIKASKVVAFEDLGMEAIYEFEVKDMPVTVAVDSCGSSVHNTGPAEWRVKIGKIPVIPV